MSRVQEVRQVDVGSGAGVSDGGGARIHRGLGDLANLAAQAGQPVEVGRQRSMEVRRAAGDRVLTELLAGAVLAVIAPGRGELLEARVSDREHEHPAWRQGGRARFIAAAQSGMAISTILATAAPNGAPRSGSRERSACR
jgi:hypothetical protein